MPKLFQAVFARKLTVDNHLKKEEYKRRIKLWEYGIEEEGWIKDEGMRDTWGVEEKRACLRIALTANCLNPKQNMVDKNLEKILCLGDVEKILSLEDVEKILNLEDVEKTQRLKAVKKILFGRCKENIMFGRC